MNMLKRGSGVLGLLLLVSCLLILIVQSPNAFAETKKMSGTGKVVAVLSETKMLPGDDPHHEVTLLRRLDVQKSNLGEAQVNVVDVSDSVAGSGTDRGHLVSTFSDGDKTFVSFEGQVKAVPKAGGPPEVTFMGKWRFTGGTGKWNGITGGGTYQGGITSAGPTYQFEGEYDTRQ
jgi:hypothetical protein